jgi:hypothetical protein
MAAVTGARGRRRHASVCELQTTRPGRRAVEGLRERLPRARGTSASSDTSEPIGHPPVACLAIWMSTSAANQSTIAHQLDSLPRCVCWSASVTDGGDGNLPIGGHRKSPPAASGSPPSAFPIAWAASVSRPQARRSPRTMRSSAPARDPRLAPASAESSGELVSAAFHATERRARMQPMDRRAAASGGSGRLRRARADASSGRGSSASI